MRFRLISVWAVSFFAATVVARGQIAVNGLPTVAIPQSCTVSSGATRDRGVVPIADLGALRTIVDIPEGQDWLSAIASDGSASAWNTTTGGRKYTLYPPQERGAPEQLAKSPDARFEVWTDPVGVTHLWNVKTGERIAELSFLPPRKSNVDDGRYGSVEFSPDGGRVAVRTMEGEVELFETAHGRKIAQHRFLEQIHTIRFSQDGDKLIATVAQVFGKYGEEGGLAVLDAANGNVILNYFDTRPLSRHHWEINRAGTRLLETNNLRSLLVAETGTGLNRAPPQDAYWDAHFTADGAFVIAREGDKTRIIDTKDGRVALEFDDLAAQPQYYVLDFDLRFHPTIAW